MAITHGLKNFDQVSYEQVKNRWVLTYPNNSGAQIWCNDKHYSIALTHDVKDGTTLVGNQFQETKTVIVNAEEIYYGFGDSAEYSPYSDSIGLPFNKTLTGVFEYWKSNDTSLTTFPDNFTKVGSDTWTITTPKETEAPVITVSESGGDVTVSVTGGKAPTSDNAIQYQWQFYTYMYSLNDGPWEQWKSSTESSLTLTNLAPGSTYKFQVISQVRVSNIPFTWTAGSKTFNILQQVGSNIEEITTGGSRPIVETATVDGAYKWRFTYYPISENDTEQSFHIYGTMQSQSNWGSWNQINVGLQMVEFVRDDSSQTANLFTDYTTQYTYALYETGQTQVGTEFYLNSTKTPPNGDLGWQDLGIISIPKDRQVRKWSLHFVMDALNADLTIPDVFEIEIAAIPPTLDSITNVTTTQDSITATFNISDWGSSLFNTYSIRALMYDTPDFKTVYYYKKEELEGIEPESYTYTFTNKTPKNGMPLSLQPNAHFYLTFDATHGEITNNSKEIVVEAYTKPKNYIEFYPGNNTPTYNAASLQWNRDLTYSQALVETKTIWYKADDETEWKTAYSGTDNNGTLNLINLRAGRRYEFKSEVRTDVGSDEIIHGYLFKTATMPSDPKDLSLYWHQDLNKPIAKFRSITTSNDNKEQFTPEKSSGRAGTMLARRIDDTTIQLEASIITTGHELSITDSSQAIGLQMLPDDEQLLNAFNSEYNKVYTELTWDEPWDSYLDNYNHTGAQEKMYGVNLFRIPYSESFEAGGLKWDFNSKDQTITLNGTLTNNRSYPYIWDYFSNQNRGTDMDMYHNWMYKIGNYISENDWLTASIEYISGSISTEGSVQFTAKPAKFGTLDVVQYSPLIESLPKFANSSSFSSVQNPYNDVELIQIPGIYSPSTGITFDNYTFKYQVLVTQDEITDQPKWTEPERFGVLPYSGQDYVGYYHIDENEFSATSPNIVISMKRRAHVGGAPELKDFKEILGEQTASMKAGTWEEFDQTTEASELIDDLSIYSHRTLKLTIKDKNDLESYAATINDYAADFIPGHKYFVTFKVKSNQDTTVETFWPEEAGHNITYNVAGNNKWQDLNAVFTATSASSSTFRFRFDNNQSNPPHANQVVYFTMPILVDISLPLGVGKEPPILWCEKNLTYDFFYPNPAEAQLLNENDTQAKEPDYTYFIGDFATQPYNTPIYAEKITTQLSSMTNGTIYFETDKNIESRQEIEFKELLTEEEFNQITPQPNKIYYITENSDGN